MGKSKEGTARAGAEVSLPHVLDWGAQFDHCRHQPERLGRQSWQSWKASGMHPWTSGAVQGSPLMKTVTQNIWTSDQWKALHWRRLLHRTYEQVTSGRFSIDEDCYTEHMNKWPVQGSPLTKTVTQNIWTSDQWKALHWRLLHRTYEQVTSGRFSIDEDCYTEHMNKWSVEGSPLKTVTQNVWTSDQWKALHWWRLSHRTYEQVIRASKLWSNHNMLELTFQVHKWWTLKYTVWVYL